MIRALLLLALLVASGLAQSVASSAAASAGIYIALGDSIAAGIGTTLPRERSYPALIRPWLEQALGGDVALAPLAMPGETSASFVAGGQLQRFRDEVQRARDGGVPVVAVTVTLGGNELLSLEGSSHEERQAALDTFRREYDAALAAVRETIGPETPLAVTTVYDPTDGDPALPQSDSWWIAQYNAAIVEIAERYQCAVADIAMLFRGQARAYTGYPVDVHPTNAGQRVIAGTVWGALGIDRDAPVIEVLSPTEMLRSTPTLRLRVREAVTGTTVQITAGEAPVWGPVQADDETWLALLDLRDTADPGVTVTITATDVAGNASRLETTLRLDQATE